MKKVLVYGMTGNPGGIESYLLNLVQKVEYGTFDFVTDFPQIAYSTNLKELGCDIYYIPAKRTHPIEHLKALSKILKSHPEYKCIYFNILDAGAVFTMLPVYFSKRINIVHSHNGAANKMWLHKLCQPLLNKISQHKVACSYLASDYMFGKKYRKNVLIVPNAIDIEKFRFKENQRIITREELQLEDRFVLCHIGRMSYQKNPFGLLDIFAAVLQKNPSAILLYIGVGELEKTIVEYAEKRKIEKSIRFLGVRKDIPALLSASDVFLLPSFYEGLPIVGVEAQASGIPCVLSDAVTKEVDITKNIVFCSLNSPPEKWAEVILQTKGRPRSDFTEEIKAAGYDMKHSSEAYNKLIQLLV